MYELKRKIGLLLGDRKEVLKRNKLVQKALAYINLQNSKKRNALVRNYGTDALKILYEECREENVDLCLDFGTHLGYYRQKGFISYDMDIDLGAFYKDIDKFQILKSKLLQREFTYSRKFEYENRIVEESYSYHGLNIDIVYYDYYEKTHNLNSVLVVYAMDMNKHPVDIRGYEEKNRLEALETAEFMGVTVQIPRNIEEYLKNYYGADFMTPIPNFDWKSSGLYLELEDSSKCKAKVYDGEEFSK